MTDLSDNMKLFFKDSLNPDQPDSAVETYGLLYLLRCDVFRCFGIDPDGPIHPAINEVTVARHNDNHGRN